MFPPLALVTAFLLVRIDFRTLQRLLTPQVATGTALTVFLFFAYDRFAPAFASDQLPADVLIDFGAYVKAAAAIATAGGIAMMVIIRKGALAPKARFAGIAVQSLTVLASLQIAIAGFDSLSPMRSSSAILQAAQQTAPFAADAPVYQVAMYDQTVPFYLRRPTRGVAYRDEMALGIDAEPQKQVPTLEAWLAEWMSLPQGYAVMEPRLYAQLVAQGVPMRELARDPRRVVVSRQ